MWSPIAVSARAGSKRPRSQTPTTVTPIEPRRCPFSSRVLPTSGVWCAVASAMWRSSKRPIGCDMASPPTVRRANDWPIISSSRSTKLLPASAMMSTEASLDALVMIGSSAASSRTVKATLVLRTSLPVAATSAALSTRKQEAAQDVQVALPAAAADDGRDLCGEGLDHRTLGPILASPFRGRGLRRS